MATYTYTNCTYDSTTKTVTPIVNPRAETYLYFILCEGLYERYVYNDLNYMVTNHLMVEDLEAMATLLANNVFKYAIFLEDVSTEIELLETNYSLESLLKILRAMAYASSVESTINSLEAEYYYVGKITITPTYNMLAEMGTTQGLGMRFNVYSDVDTDFTFESNFTISPMYCVHGTPSDGSTTAIQDAEGYFVPILTDTTDVSKAFGSPFGTSTLVSEHPLHFYKGYNANVFFDSIPSDKTSLNYNVGDLYTQYRSQHSRYITVRFTQWDSMEYVGWSFNTTSTDDGVTGNVTISFRSALTFPDGLPDFIRMTNTMPGRRHHVCCNYETVCNTVGCSVEQTIDTISESVDDLDESVTDIQEELTLDGNVFTDSAFYESGWSYYSEDYPPRVYKYGKVVTFTGAFTNTASKSADGSDVQIMTLPEAYRPAQKMFAYCQGSSYNHWLMTVDTDGAVYIRRYGTTSNQSMSASRWLPFTITYVIS